MSRPLLSVASGALASAPAPSIDYYVASDSDWAMVFANTDATLSGKTIGIVGSSFTRRSILGGRTFAGGLTITSVDANGKLPGLTLDPVNNLKLLNLNMTMTDWPKLSSGVISFQNGQSSNFQMIGGNYRHGYGPTNQDFVSDYQYPEYGRGIHNLTAAAVSVAYPLTWLDKNQGGWIEVYNQGTVTVYVALSNSSSVVATTSSTACPPNVRTRITTGVFDYAAILAASGTAAIVMHTEVGMLAYLASLFFSDGISGLHDPRFIGVNVSDIGEAFRNLHLYGDAVFMDNVVRRCYADIYASGWPLDNVSSLYFMRNLSQSPFALGGVSPSVFGNLTDHDARDPHGDINQLYNGTSIATRVYSGGNRNIPSKLRAGVTHQGMFFTLNGYQDVSSIADCYMGGSANSFITASPAQNNTVYGLTAVSWRSPTDNAQIVIQSTTTGDNYVGYSIASQISTAPLVGKENNYIVPSNQVMTNIFPNWAGLSDAYSRDQLNTAITTAGAAAGMGCVAIGATAIDWVTTDHTQVIKWPSLPAFIVWNDVVFQTPSALVYSDIRKVKGPSGTLSVTPDAGTSFQVTSDFAGTSVVHAWSSSPGTVDRGQFIQIRAAASSFYQTTTTAGIVLNGFHESFNITTRPADPTVFWTSTASGPGFVDTTATTSSNNGSYVLYVKFKTTDLSTSRTLAMMAGLQLTLDISTTGQIRIALRDNANTTIYASNTPIAPAGTIAVNTWCDLILSISLSLGRVVLWVNSTLIADNTITPGATTFQNNRVMNFMQSTSASNRWVGSVSDIRFWKNVFLADGTLPTSTPYKAIGPDAATVNADAWKVGAAAT